VIILKTYEEWEGNLHDYLQVNDLVDEKIAKRFLDIVPPTCFNGNIIQMGEAYSNIDGKSTYPTLKMTTDGWAYAGHCFIGKTENIN
jgi:hypothetical protein